ncbi:RNA polymerase II subunit 5-mediating protein homolog isoform X2 [Cephus cinctus]|uniref:RNA polymerase II subunit 5-mediating protein homolog isoform X2 n=1 Tax=Cephus cinctus TaxID=211228 RepID=A0AAJ7VZK8_CEPCN|nr:RNA polymerase II subunit 5-mediating protein homolog isoform X2 [Cephus cinctus]
MSYAIRTLVLKLSVLLPLLVVVYSGVSSTESIGNLTKKEIKNTANVTLVSSVLQDAAKNTSLPRKDAVAIVEAPVDGRQELEKEGATKMEKKRESQVVRSKEKVKSKLRETNKRKTDSLEILDDINERNVENIKDDNEDEDNSYDQDNEDVDDNCNDKGHIFKSGMRNKKEDAKNEPSHYSEEGQRSDDDDEEEFQRKFKRGEDEPKIWDQWSKWSCCSSSCGPGKLTRWRHCVAGACHSGEKEVQIRSCQLAACLH